MTTSHPISKMSPPRNGEKVPGVTFSYFNARNRRRQYEFLIQEFNRSGISQAELAIRTGKSRAQISRLLGQPSNLTSNTFCELLFAIRGHEIEYAATNPFAQRSRQQPIAINYDIGTGTRKGDDIAPKSSPSAWLKGDKPKPIAWAA